jgi:inosine/xanthosine triphosphate pyrophosphatase family protein
VDAGKLTEKPAISEDSGVRLAEYTSFPILHSSDGYREEMMKTLRVISEVRVTVDVHTRECASEK